MFGETKKRSHIVFFPDAMIVPVANFHAGHGPPCVLVQKRRAIINAANQPWESRDSTCFCGLPHT